MREKTGDIFVAAVILFLSAGGNRSYGEGTAEKINPPAVQFFALGCAGSGNEGQRKVAQSMAMIAAQHPIDFTLYLGDNFYGPGVSSVNDSQWQSKFEEIYKQEPLQIPFYAVLGNNDYNKNPEVQIAYSKKSARWRMPARYYSFEKTLDDDTRIEFFALDTVALVEERDKDQLQWLEKKLRSSKADWKIVYGHYPVYSGASTWLTEIQKMRQLVEPIFTQQGVDLYLAAHNHSIEIFRNIAGVAYVVSGAGSRPFGVSRTDQKNFTHADLGFTWFRISKNEMAIHVVGKEGQEIFNDKIFSGGSEVV